MACVITNRLQLAVPKTSDQDLFYNSSNWIVPRSSSCSEQFFNPPTMKFPISVMGKKNTSKRRTSESENNNLNTTMLSSQTIANERTLPSTVILHSASEPQMVCEPQQDNCGRLEVNNNIPDGERCGVDRCLDRNGNPDDGQSKELEDVCSSVCGGRSRSNSMYDDSGFNSSASDDKDDECDNVENVCKDSLRASLSFPRRILSDSQLELSKGKPSLKAAQSTDSLKCAKRRRDTSLLSNGQLSSITSHDSLLTDSSLSVASSRLSIASSTSSLPTHSHRRRRARQDQNNNEVAAKPLSKHLMKSPVHLQDCFQKNGILTFGACIIYTLVLAVLFGVLGLAVSSVKSYIGKQDLNDLKEHIRTRRRHRPTVASH